ncbi:4036_t:CDS:2, partial [Acaulospora morrowiae]
MSRGDSGYMSSSDCPDIFEKTKEEIKQIEELYRIKNSRPFFVDQNNGSCLTDNLNNNAPPLQRNKSPKILPSDNTPNEAIPTGSSVPKILKGKRSRAFSPSSEQQQSTPGPTIPIHRATASLDSNQVKLTSEAHKMRQKSAPCSPQILPLSRLPLPIPVTGSAPTHRKAASVSTTLDAHKMGQQLAPNSPPLLPLPRNPPCMSVSGSTTPIHRVMVSQGYNQATSTFDSHKIKQQSAPCSPPLLPLPRLPQSMPVSGSTTPVHRVTALQGGKQITSTASDAHKIRQALLYHRKMSLINESSPEAHKVSNESSTPLPPAENAEVLSPCDFRDLIEQYYEDLDEMDTREEKKLLEEMAAKNRKREAAVKEIVTTERTYVDGINKCVEYFLKPLRGNCQKSNHRHTLLFAKPFVTSDEISSIFGNIEMILSLHQQLLKSLEERYSEWNPTSLISDIFLQNAPFLKMYTVYVKNFPRAIELTERLEKGSKEFRKFIQSILGKAELGGLSFNSFLSLPIQRIPRYKLLLEALLKHTDESHPDFFQLENCVKQISVIADEVNEKIKEAENQNKVLEIQNKVERCPIIVNPARKFIREGDLFKVLYRHTVKKTACFVSTTETLTHYLFNDLVVCCSKVQGKITYQEQIDLNYASIVDIEDNLSDKPFCFKIIVKTPLEERHHIVRALDECTKLDWILKLEDAICTLRNGNIEGR